MRILYIANVRLPTERAHGIQIVKTCEALAREGVEVTLLIPNTFNHLKDDLFTYYGIDRIFTLAVVPSFDWRKFGRLGYTLHTLYFTVAAIVYALTNRRQLIYSRSRSISLFASLIRLNVVYEDHEPPRSKLQLYAFFLRRIPKKVVVAYNLGQLYDRLGIRSYIVAPNGVDLTQFDRVERQEGLWERTCGIVAETPVVLYVGHFYPWKGVYTLVDGAKKLAPVAVVLFGATVETREKIKHYCAQNDITNVFILDFLPHREVIPYIKSADVLVLPNTASEERAARYTTPIKLFEYMASNVAIAASNIPSFTPYVRDGENAKLFTADDKESLVTAIKRLLADDALRLRLAQCAHKDVQAFTWRKRARKIVAFVHD